MALYIDAQRASLSPRLRPFAGMSVAELQGNASFYEAMMTPEVGVLACMCACGGATGSGGLGAEGTTQHHPARPSPPPLNE